VHLIFLCCAVGHPNTLNYPGGAQFFDDARAIAQLSQEKWPEISEQRIRSALTRISRGSFLPPLLMFLFSCRFLPFFLYINLCSLADAVDWVSDLPAEIVGN